MRLGEAIKSYRATRVPSMGIRAAAKEIGISPTTLSKVERGHMPDQKALQSIWGWLTFPGSDCEGLRNELRGYTEAYNPRPSVKGNTSDG